MRRLPLSLDPDIYAKLEALAKAEERDPIQQARLLIRRALEQCDKQPVEPEKARPQ